jgi:hypothetical protein
MVFWLLVQAVLIAFPKFVGRMILGIFGRDEGDDAGFIEWLLGIVVILISVVVIAACQAPSRTSA